MTFTKNNGGHTKSIANMNTLARLRHKMVAAGLNPYTEEGNRLFVKLLTEYKKNNKN